MSIDLIRNRPVFDKEILKPGIAIKYRERKNYDKNNKWEQWAHALVTSVTLENLSAIICLYENEEEQIDISVSEIIEGLYEIDTLS